MRKIVLYILIFLSFTACKENKNTDEFHQKIIVSYNKCENKDNCLINFLEIFPFAWDKIYVFSNEHYPEAGANAISKVTGVKYRGKRKFLENRSVLFINKDKVVHEILTYYEPDGYIDTKPMFVDFIYKDNFPLYFEKDNAIFKLTKDVKLTKDDIGEGYSLEFISKGGAVN